MFAPLDLRFGTGRLVLALGRPAVGFIFDLFSLGISGNGVIPLFSAEVSAVPINRIDAEIPLKYSDNCRA